ncbi:transcription termination factor Rho [Nocardioides sp. S5]|uniref:transcription termination factor Rho n=1 Tax=Nocardioides sp. S5 TaxID=2017486 RepID=UPI001A90324E|nr:transcription termination factor Rho [Nocardioides sp. S5]QSR30369.1 transcription termination factor Rho [Nocardioides sp. S5]
MTETPPAATPADSQDAAPDAATKPARKASKSGGLGSMLLADLKSMAGGMGIAGAGSMKKAQLVEAIKAAQSPAAQSPAASAEKQDQKQASQQARASAQPEAVQSEAPARTEEPAPQTTVRTRTRKQRAAEQAAEAAEQKQPEQKQPEQKQPEQPAQKQKQQDKQDQKTDKQNDKQQGQKQGSQKQGNQQGQRNQERLQDQRQEQRNQEQRGQDQREQRAQEQRAQDRNQDRQQDQRQQEQDDDEDGEGGSRRNRRRRGRDRTTPRAGGNRSEPDTTILEDDVLVPAAGILDVLDNCAFVRTSGYLPGPEDVYLSLSMVRKYHLRRGDAVVGQVRQPREGERREKFNPMVRIDSINGTEAEGAKERPEFSDAVPVHPHQRLRLATDDANPTGKVIDIAAPVGKGQRGLILTPPRTGATSLLQSIAQAVTTNNPECHVMVVLVDARPEEVTDFQRAVKGEVVASTFDRQPADHTLVAELAIERAKRLVELGHDVVVLLDSLTRLGRAYNLAAPANGRVLAGIVDASAVHPTKEFFGAARKIEDAGSLTVLATVAVGTGSATDEFFLEEIAGTENWELALSAERAARGIVPAVDVVASGTRHEEKLLAPAEGAVVGDIRKQLAAADSSQAVSKVIGAR